MNDELPSTPRTPKSTPERRFSFNPTSVGRTPRTPYAMVYKARMITSTIRRRRHGLGDDVMTPHAIMARQVLANTPGRRMRLDDPQERVSPRDELRALSRVLAREKNKISEATVDNKLSGQKSINSSNGSKKSFFNALPDAFPDLGDSSGFKKNLSVDETPTRRSSKGSDIMKSLSGTRVELQKSSNEPDPTPSRRPSDGPRRISNSSIRSDDLRYRSISPPGNQSIASQFSIEMNRRVESRLSWNRDRLSESFPEFKITHNEIDDKKLKSNYGRQNYESPTPDSPQKRRKDSNPFVIQVENIEIPDLSQLPDNKIPDDKIPDVFLLPEDDIPADEVILESELNDTISNDLRHDVTELSRFEENIEPPIEEPNETIDFEIASVPLIESEQNITAPEISDTELSRLTTKDDHDAYSILVEEDKTEDSLFVEDNIENTPPVSGPRNETVLQSMHLSLRQPSSAENSQESNIEKLVRRSTLPDRIIKELTSSMTGRRIQPAALLEIFEASERFFEQAGVDLAAYSRHAKRKTIDPTDVLQLMRRQRVISESDTPYILAKKYLPQELVDNIIEATAP